MALLVYLVLFLALTGHSSALYCLCKDDVSDKRLQEAIDYACGTGADCTAILQNGVCYQPNTVKDHCNYAVNSYYQRKGNAQGTCDFTGTATTSLRPPSTSPGCVYPSSPGNATTPPSTGSPGTTPSTGTTPGSGSGSGTGPVIGSPEFGMGPTASTGPGGVNDNAAGVPNLKGTYPRFLFPLILTFLLVYLRV